MVPKLSFICEPLLAQKTQLLFDVLTAFSTSMTNSCTLHGYSRFFQKTGTLNFCRQKLSCVCHHIWIPVCRQSTAPLPLQVFAIFSIAFLCLIGFNSCVVNSSVLFCAGSGRKRSPAGLTVDSLNLTADFFLQFSRCTSALHIKAFPSLLLALLRAIH